MTGIEKFVVLSKLGKAARLWTLNRGGGGMRIFRDRKSWDIWISISSYGIDIICLISEYSSNLPPLTWNWTVIGVARGGRPWSTATTEISKSSVQASTQSKVLILFFFQEKTQNEKMKFIGLYLGDRNKKWFLTPRGQLGTLWTHASWSARRAQQDDPFSFFFEKFSRINFLFRSGMSDHVEKIKT